MTYAKRGLSFGQPFSLPWDPEVTLRDQETAAELWSDHLARETRDRHERERALAQKIQRYREGFRERLGGEGYAALTRLKAEFRDELRRKRRLPHGLNMSDQEVRDAWQDRLRGFGERFDFRPEMVHAPFAELLEDVVQLSPHADLFAEYVPDYGGMGPPSEPANPWVTFKPPFSGWQSGYDTGLLGDFGAGRTALLNPATGHVGNILTLDCTDAGNFSCGSVWGDTQVAFWFTAPVTGLVEVNIVAHCGEARHYLHVRDEWGVSDYGVVQNCYLMMHAIHANVRGAALGKVSVLDVEGDLSTYRDEHHILPGEVVSVTLVSDGPVAAGDKFVIRAGSRSSDGAIVNDMECNSRSAFSWFLSSVNVRIKP